MMLVYYMLHAVLHIFLPAVDSIDLVSLLSCIDDDVSEVEGSTSTSTIHSGTKLMRSHTHHQSWWYTISYMPKFLPAGASIDLVSLLSCVDDDVSEVEGSTSTSAIHSGTKLMRSHTHHQSWWYTICYMQFCI
jgi:hypothetical protein